MSHASRKLVKAFAFIAIPFYLGFLMTVWTGVTTFSVAGWLIAFGYIILIGT